jgi:AcrR family transcriptional regulator
MTSPHGRMAPVSTSRRTQQERSADSARRLLDAAIELIAEFGWERTTSAAISRRAGFSQSMVNVRYGSKEALLEALQRSYEERFVPDQYMAGSGLERTLGQIERLREEARDNRDALRAFLMLCFETIGPITSLRPWIEDWFDRYVANLAAAIDDGRRDGSIRAEVDARAEAQHFLDAGTGICFSWVLRPTANDFDAALTEWAVRLQHWLAPR